MAKYLRCGPRFYTLVDDDFFVPEEVSLAYVNSGYAELKPKNKDAAKRIARQLLHRHILGLTNGYLTVVDHINGDKLDNRKRNLRHCSPQQNGRNRLAKCACYDKSKKSWLSSVSESNVLIFLGRFKTEREAIECSNAYKLANWGEFARIWPIEQPASFRNEEPVLSGQAP